MNISAQPQTKAYSCGPAALATIGNILGKHISEKELIEKLEAQPNIGTDNTIMYNWAKENLPVISCGEDTYTDGLSIWNIQNALSGIGHFVVVLGVQDNIVRYYDPYWVRTLEFHKDSIKWISGDHKYKKWSINFKCSFDTYNLNLNSDSTYNKEWALRSVDRWLDNNSIKPKQRMCPSGGGTCVCSPQDACSLL